MTWKQNSLAGYILFPAYGRRRPVGEDMVRHWGSRPRVPSDLHRLEHANLLGARTRYLLPRIAAIGMLSLHLSFISPSRKISCCFAKGTVSLFL